MDAGKRYIVLKAFERALKDALGEANADIRALVVKCGGHLRRLFTEIQKSMHNS